MGKVKILRLYTELDYGLPKYQEVLDNETGKYLFKVSDLTEYPEDATLYRELFNGEEYIEAVRFGMQLAANGYTSIDVIKERREYD